jgi:hypothetical protein
MSFLTTGGGWLGRGTEHVVRHSSASLCALDSFGPIFRNELQRRHNCNDNPKVCLGTPQVLCWMAWSGGSGNERLLGSNPLVEQCRPREHRKVFE